MEDQIKSKFMFRVISKDEMPIPSAYLKIFNDNRDEIFSAQADDSGFVFVDGILEGKFAVLIFITNENGQPIFDIPIVLLDESGSELYKAFISELGYSVFRSISVGVYTIKVLLTIEELMSSRKFLSYSERIDLKESLFSKHIKKSDMYEDSSYREKEIAKMISDLKETVSTTYSLESPLGLPDAQCDCVKVPVFYGTNRKGFMKGKKWNYGNERGSLNFGLTWVSIPKNHKKGEIERPSIFKLEFRENPKKHIVLISVNPLSNSEFFIQLKKNVQKSKDKIGMIFIHGFNTTFEEGVQRTAQMAYDLAIETPIMFSWPSCGVLSHSGYIRDETNLDFSEVDIKNFIEQIAKRSGLTKLHLVAHSMGNRGLLSFLKDFSSQVDPNNKFFINEVILTAPDIDAETFRKNIAPKIIGKTQRITLYTSADDMALNYSQRVNKYPRLGDSGENIVLVKGIDTVDVSTLKTGFFGHDYFAENIDVLNDICSIMKKSLPPEKRNLLKKVTVQGHYWSFR